MTRIRGLGAVLGIAGVALGCASSAEFAASSLSYTPDRHDYRAFRERHPELLEPNYLPFMLHRYSGSNVEGDALAFCRWPLEEMPIPVYVPRPAISESLQNEFDPKDPDAYVASVGAALDVWEAELGGLVGFERVDRREDARLQITLVAQEGPRESGDRQLLGRIDLRKACRVHAEEADGERLSVTFSVPEVRIYLADRHGLLGADQIEWVALHEIGHALGMRHHSPIPSDLMYEMVRDRVQVDGLSLQDVNSFVSLYRLPNGTVFTRMAPGAEVAPSKTPLPGSVPRLDGKSHEDPRLGFSIRPPLNWLRTETARGMVAVDGTTWDYTASFQVIVQRYPTIEAYLERYGHAYRRHGRVLRDVVLEVNGYPARQMSIANTRLDVVEQITFIEAGDGRVFVVIADCPVESTEAYRPWFEAVLASLEIWDVPQDRRFSPAPRP